MKKLNRKGVSTISRPVKVLQFGEGNFLRAFVDWIIDNLNEKTGFNGNVCVIQPIQNGMGNKVNEQDGLYHVVLNGISNQKATREIRLITCVEGVTNPFLDFQAYLDLAVNPDLKFIVSNTTEAGIVFNPKDTNPDTLSESFPGKLTTLLYHRFKKLSATPESGLILLPCELVEKNGLLLRTAILQYIDHWHLPDAFKKWIIENNTFCNTLVDRIVPGFPKETINEIKEETGFDDNLVVMAEPFHLWVIEAPSHVQEVLPTAKAGLQVIFANDLTPYRTRKVRILNGAHTAMVPVAYLNGLRTVRESIED
ncbi:MAG TPA: tagaturonate reductase, partial [Cyclobacteriaceae bacterium]|nr:tagaturonate reductase [Cyclobacteriaceae bacterium]